MGHYSFEADLRAAKAVEWDLACLLYQRGKTALVETNDDRRYDLRVMDTRGRWYTIEVKNDMLHEKTGNIGVEFESRSKASGIAVTEADYWCFALYDGFWFIKSDKLRQLISENSYFRVAVGGDLGSVTKMYLFKGRLLKNHMTLIA